MSPLPAARRKLGQALARRGFAWEDIGSAWKGCWAKMNTRIDGGTP